MIVSPRKTLLLAFLLFFNVITGCAYMGLAQPSSLEERIAYAISQNAAVREAAAVSVERKELSVDDAKRVLKITDEVRTALDAARLAAGAGDISTAEGRLQLATSILVNLQAYLRSRA